MDKTAKPLVWICPRCGVEQPISEVRTVEIEEPGRSTRIEFHGKIRPSFDQKHGTWYSCLVCGNFWSEPPEDPTPGGSSVTFLHPINETNDEIAGYGIDRDAC